ncbi:MAG: hypothetical protein ABJA79_10550 [Parafilimonas sp.]
MKKIISIGFVGLISISAFCQNKISVDSVSSHIGESVQVCSKVYGVKSLEKVTFINLGASYPHSPLIIVIFAKDIGNFKEPIERLYDNKEICITGILKEYKGKAEIVVSKPDEIKFSRC